MCEPMTIAAVAGTVISAYGAYEQGQGQKRIANYNAKVAELNADDVLKRSTIAADQQRARARQILSTQRAVMGASGAEVGTGTLGAVLDQTAKLGELDARQIEQNAQREAWGLKTQAKLGQYEGSVAAQAGNLSAFGSILTGGAQAYGIYKQNTAGLTQARYDKSVGMINQFNATGGFRR